MNLSIFRCSAAARRALFPYRSSPLKPFSIIVIDSRRNKSVYPRRERRRREKFNSSKSDSRIAAQTKITQLTQLKVESVAMERAERRRRACMNLSGTPSPLSLPRIFALMFIWLFRRALRNRSTKKSSFQLVLPLFLAPDRALFLAPFSSVELVSLNDGRSVSSLFILQTEILVCSNKKNECRWPLNFGRRVRDEITTKLCRARGRRKARRMGKVFSIRRNANSFRLDGGVRRRNEGKRG